MNFKALRQGDFLRDKVEKGGRFLEIGKGKAMHRYKSRERIHRKFGCIDYIIKRNFFTGVY